MIRIRSLVKTLHRYASSTTSSSSSSRKSSYSLKSHTCGELRSTNVGDRVDLYGWVAFNRGNKFIVLRDHDGSVQVVVNNKLADKLSLESVVRVRGEVVMRPRNQVNHEMGTGSIEVVSDDVTVMNKCVNLPFRTTEPHLSGVSEEMRLKYRYLDVRGDKMQANLRKRAKFISSLRRFLEDEEFVEVETPTLYKFTPGGADEFIVPSSLRPGMFYSLPQSPQLMKQFLMVGGIDRYFQVAKCYRNESLHSNRQPEFTQLDIEMSFVQPKHIMSLVEDMLRHCWPRPLINKPFPVMTYDDAMTSYGCDKPDVRYEATIEKVDDVTHLIRFARTSHRLHDDSGELRSRLDDVITRCLADDKTVTSSQQPRMSIVTRHNDDIVTSSPCGDHVTSSRVVRVDEGEVCVTCVCDDVSRARKLLGRCRVEMARHLIPEVVMTSSCNDAFLWVVDFPMFEMTSNDVMKACHHPFTKPRGDVDEMMTSPLDARSEAYDLVLNGCEVGGGSVRIHDPQLQFDVLTKVLNLSGDHTTLVEALGSGAPPHAGIALGLDRLTATLCDVTSIRDVIAFPKNNVGNDTMVACPSPISEQQARKYHLTKYYNKHKRCYDDDGDDDVSKNDGKKVER